jgi:hypothetical protein
MKNLLILLAVFFSANSAGAKFVKFSVDMKGTPVDSHGVHVTGDFQDEAGFPADWDPGTTAMTKEVSDTNIWSVVVNIPAFRHYEFKFINGIFGYQVEFVPWQSRVHQILNDSRWIYVDSLGSDTMEFGAIRFAGNAPFGKYLLRFYVDLQNEASIDTVDGVHVGGNFQGWNAATTRMYSFDGNVFQHITYIDSTPLTPQQEFKYANGNATGDYESVPNPCANGSNNRGVYVIGDSVLPVVCFSACEACTPAAFDLPVKLESFMVYPNPAGQFIRVRPGENVVVERFWLMDAKGSVVMEKEISGQGEFTIVRPEGNGGMYFFKVIYDNGTVSTTQVVFD